MEHEGKAPSAADGSVVEILVAWGNGAERSVLGVHRVERGQTFFLGDEAGSSAIVPAEVLGASRVPLVVFDAAGPRVRRPARASVAVDGVLLRDEEIALEPHRKVRVFLDGFSFRVMLTDEERAPRASLLAALRSRTTASLSFSAIVHAALTLTCAALLPPLGETDAEAMVRERIVVMQRMLDAAAEREREALPAEAQGGAAPEGAPELSGAARGESGKRGVAQPKQAGRFVVRGAGDDTSSLPRTQRLAEARDFGMIELLGQASGGFGIVSPFSSPGAGTEALVHLGDAWSATLGDVAGTGLSLSGVGEGGDGLSDGVGLRDLGGLGDSLAKRGPGGGGGPGGPGGFGGCQPGKPCGLGVRGDHTPKVRMRFAEKLETNGRLPAEVIQRIVRANAGRFRACYEMGLRESPGLEGRVVVRFVIDRTGGVPVAADGGSDLAHDAVRACAVRAFQSLSFPAPDNGTVTVTYPLLFTKD